MRDEFSRALARHTAALSPLSPAAVYDVSLHTRTGAAEGAELLPDPDFTDWEMPGWVLNHWAQVRPGHEEEEPDPVTGASDEEFASGYWSTAGLSAPEEPGGVAIQSEGAHFNRIRCAAAGLVTGGRYRLRATAVLKDLGGVPALFAELAGNPPWAVSLPFPRLVGGELTFDEVTLDASFLHAGGGTADLDLYLHAPAGTGILLLRSVSLKSAPGGGVLEEVSGGGYARRTITNGTAFWANHGTDPRAVTNTAALRFPAAGDYAAPLPVIHALGWTRPGEAAPDFYTPVTPPLNSTDAGFLNFAAGSLKLYATDPVS